MKNMEQKINLYDKSEKKTASMRVISRKQNERLV